MRFSVCNCSGQAASRLRALIISGGDDALDFGDGDAVLAAVLDAVRGIHLHFLAIVDRGFTDAGSAALASFLKACLNFLVLFGKSTSL